MAPGTAWPGRRAAIALMGHIVPGRRPVAEALAAGRVLDKVLYDPRSGVDALVDQARAAKVLVRPHSGHELDQLTSGVRHQGIVAVARELLTVPLSALAGKSLVVILDGITDPQNLGAIARSADAAGASGLVIRERRAAGVSPAAEKASAGAFSWLPLCVVPNIVAALGVLTQSGAWSVGLDGDAKTSLYDSNLLEGNVALVIGAEGDGLSRLVRQRVDQLVGIPMHGHMASLNASAAAAVALFEVARRQFP